MSSVIYDISMSLDGFFKASCYPGGTDGRRRGTAARLGFGDDEWDREVLSTGLEARER